MILQLAWIVSFCVCAALTMASDEVVQLCFGYGKMTTKDLEAVAYLFRIGVWAMPGMLLVAVWQQMLYAQEHTRPPLYVSLMQTVLMLITGAVGLTLFGAVGVMGAYALIHIPAVFWLAWHGHKHKMIARYKPSVVYMHMTLVAAVIFIPLSVWFSAATRSPLPAVILAVVMGVISLGAALMVFPAAREMIRNRKFSL